MHKSGYDWDSEIQYKIRKGNKNLNTRVIKWYSPLNGEWVATRISVGTKICMVFLTNKGQWVSKGFMRSDEVRRHLEIRLQNTEGYRLVEAVTQAEKMLCILAERKYQSIS